MTKLILAPMDGVFDAPMRALIAETGGFDFAVSEFIRVSQEPIRAKAILRDVPELAQKHMGRDQLPVQVQLLGSDPDKLAETAEEACIAGAKTIDLNFGCPSPTVIRNRGGAALLKEPALIHEITKAVREKLPAIIKVSAKVRLGWESTDEAMTIAKAAEDGGADWLVVHARTKAELYRPGVHWEPVRKIKEQLKIPVIANGDLFSETALQECITATGCEQFMIGRGALLDPMLGRRLARTLGVTPKDTSLMHLLDMPYEKALTLAIKRFIEIAQPYGQNSGYVPCRIKQWLGSIRRIEPEKVPRSLMVAAGKARSASELLAMIEKAI